MLRTALTPRWLALLALVLLVCAAFGWLGWWQLGVARDKGHAEALARARTAPTVALQDVLRPGQPFPESDVGRSVRVTGAYDGARRLLVTDRRQGGRPGFWLLVPLRTTAGELLPVVRGWVPSADDPAAAVPAGQVTVTGTLQPTEPPTDVSPGAGRVDAVDTADLVNRWPDAPLYNGFVVLTAQDPPASPPAATVQVVPEQASGLAWRNAAYALEWWVFAAFALVLWGRMVADDHRRRDPWAQDVVTEPADDRTDQMVKE